MAFAWGFLTVMGFGFTLAQVCCDLHIGGDSTDRRDEGRTSPVWTRTMHGLMHDPFSWD